MEVTEVRIKLMENSEDRLRAFCSITIDYIFVFRDLKIIEGNSGPFVAMPSRKLTSNCSKCRSKNHIRARYCNNCGTRQRKGSPEIDSDGRAKLYADIAHPVNAECREMIQQRVVEEFENELQRAAQPGYHSRYDDDYETDHRAEKNETQQSNALPTAESKPDEIKRVDPAASRTPKPHRRIASMRNVGK